MSDSKGPGSVGQVPTDVADEMVRRMFADGGPEFGERILFPGVGRGELVEAVSRYCERHDIDFPESIALDTNENLVEEVRNRFDRFPLDIQHLDFLSNLPDLGEFEYILSNPPVDRLRNLSPEAREDYAIRFNTVSSNNPSRDEDLYLAFFEQGLNMLALDGRLVFVTPDFTSKRGHLAIPELKRRLTTFHVEDIDSTPVESPFEQMDLNVVITTVAHAEPDPEYASKVDFDGLQEVLTVPYDIGVADIMTHDPVSSYLDDDVHDAYLTLVRNDYDAAPIRDQEEACFGLVSKADLTGADTGKISDADTKEIDESRLLPPTASFDETLNQLRRRRFCLVGTEDNVRGIVTRFDLNSMEVYFHLYAKFARFEIGLRNAIRDYSIDWEDALMDAGISWNDVKNRNEKYSEKSEVAQDELDTLLLSDLVKIIENSMVGQSIGLKESNLEVRLSSVNDLRVSVAHYQPLIHTMDTMSWTKQRTTGDFGEVYNTLNNCLQVLKNQNYV